MSEAATAGATESRKEGGVGDFVQKTRAELDKTTFPGWEEVRNTVLIVIVSVLFFAAYLYVVDRFWVYLIDAFAWLVNKIA